jgi:hypothetical protein
LLAESLAVGAGQTRMSLVLINPIGPVQAVSPERE